MIQNLSSVLKLTSWLRAENIPGYIPSELLDRKTTTQLKRTLCQRCYIIKEYNVALKVGY